MNGARSSTVTALTLTALLGTGVMRWRSAVPVAPRHVVALGATPAAGNDSLDDILADVEDLTVSSDPFRLANEPASVRFDPNKEGGGPSAPSFVAPPVRPNMTLKAIVGGPPWQAIVDGIPGQPQGTLVRAGATYDKLITRAVTRDSVVIQGPDTTWVLSFRRRP